MLYYGSEMSTFKTINAGGKEYTALKFSQSNFIIPPHILQKTRENGLIVKDDIEPFFWYGTTRESDGQYILLEKSSLEDISLITTKYRSKALRLIRKIALGLKCGGIQFLNLESSVFPLYRIYIENGENIVLLPPDASSIIALSRTEEEKEKALLNLITPTTEESFALTHELLQLMYAAVTGRFPYEEKEVRLSSYRPYDISLYSSKNKETLSFIMTNLTLSETKERALCLNNGPLYPLGWFLENTASLKWDYEDITQSERIYNIKSSEETKEFRRIKKKKERKASRRSFIRKRGALTLLILLIVSISVWFIGNIVYQNLKAPLTKDMTKEEIIEYTIEKQNELDASGINEGYKGEAAQYSEVSALYVMNRTRFAYEGKEPFVSAARWLGSNDKTIDKDSFVYGAVIESIEETSENSYKALLDWYTPYSDSDEDEADYPLKEGYVRTYLYSVEEYFTFVYNSRGWWECVESRLENKGLKSVIYIPEADGEVIPD